MIISSARALAAVLLLAAFPAAGIAQDVTAHLDTLKKSMGGNPPTVLRITAAGSGYAAKGASGAREHFRIDPFTRELDPASDESVLWTTPHGFLAGAASGKATATKETLSGTPYQVIAFTTPGGRQVRGYMNDQDVLERTRTETTDPKLGKVVHETVFLQWGDFDGLKFPTLLIQKENDQVARILVVEKVDSQASPPPKG